MSKGLRQMNVYTNRVRIYPKNGILYEPNSAMNELYEIPNPAFWENRKWLK